MCRTLRIRRAVLPVCMGRFNFLWLQAGEVYTDPSLIRRFLIDCYNS